MESSYRKRDRRLAELTVLVRGGGEMATGVVHRLVRCGFRVYVTEIPQPMAVRRAVSFCEAVFEGRKEVEGLEAVLTRGKEGILSTWEQGKVPLIVDPEALIRRELGPEVIVDAILAKRNLGTRIDDAPLVIGLGPGFSAGKDVHYVIETNRGHNLGRVIEKGEAESNTGVPGNIGGFTWERVLRAPAKGRFKGRKQIGDAVTQGEVVAEVEGVPIEAKIKGILRGVLRDGLQVDLNMKAGDIDPRGNRDHCFTISEKARAIGGGVLEAILLTYSRGLPARGEGNAADGRVQPPW